MKADLLSDGLAVVRSRLVDWKYQKTSDYALPGRKSEWYRRASDGRNSVEHVALLEYKPRSKAYSLLLGAHELRSTEKLKAILPELQRFLDPALDVRAHEYFRFPCLSLFNPGRGLQWPLLMIPDPLDRSNVGPQLDALMTRYLTPMFWPISSAQGLRELLLRAADIFDWASTNAVIRAAEIITISVGLGDDLCTVSNALQPRERYLQRDLGDRAEPSQFIRDVFDAASSQLSKKQAD